MKSYIPCHQEKIVFLPSLACSINVKAGSGIELLVPDVNPYPTGATFVSV